MNRSAVCVAALTFATLSSCVPSPPPSLPPPAEEPPMEERAEQQSEAEAAPADSELSVGEPRAEAAVAAKMEASFVPEESTRFEIPARVRVGLATDLEEIALPCCDNDLLATANGKVVGGVESLRVRPRATIASGGVWRLQVAALRDELQAEGLARQVGTLLGEPSDVVFDAATGLYRVRVGAYDSREAAEGGRRRAAQRNLHEVWIVGEPAEMNDPGLLLSQGGEEWTVPDRWLTVESRDGRGIPVLGKRYRGRIRVYLNDRGYLNIINELPFEDYLRGVVPREMGPEIFDNLDALKAQAIAARTYALRNLGEFGGEGFDICATPRCQVYGGMDGEHRLSDQAVLETRAQVLVHRGQLVDALYSSTCGGHTEDVATVFPRKSLPYLRGVPCMESGLHELKGALTPGTPLEVGLAERMVPSRGDPLRPKEIARRFSVLAARAGLSTPAGELTSIDRREVQQFVAGRFDLNLDARIFTALEDVPYLLEQTPADWSRRDLVVAAHLVRVGLFSGAVDEPLDARQLNGTLVAIGRYLRLFEETRPRFLDLQPGTLIVKHGSERTSWSVPEGLMTFRRRGSEYIAAPLALVAGDRLRLYTRGGRLLAVAHDADRDGVAYDRTSNFSTWTRFRSDEELAASVEERYPGLGFSGFEVIERGRSGRVGRLRIAGDDDRSVEVRGLPVRWTLNLPDTLFTAKRLDPEEGQAGWLFSGRGWGHGVGMCQVGSYGMAVRGHSYREILQHYYSGVEIRRLRTASPPLSEVDAAAPAG